MNEQIDPRSAAADYVAGDLTPAEAAQFEQAMAHNPAIATEVEFWKSLKSDMPLLNQPAGAEFNSTNMANVVRHRLAARQGDSQQRLRRIALSGWAVAAAASLLVIILIGRDLLRPQPFTNGTFAIGEPVAFLEDGTAISLPARGELLGPTEAEFYGDDFMPARLPVVYENAKHVPAINKVPVANQTIERPCLGIIIQPIALDYQNYKTGLLVVRVMGGSPAFKIGIRPGDVLLSINDSALYTRYCIAHAISNHKVGSSVNLAVYRQSENRSYEANATLGMYFD
jgi:hypothetical protein